MMNIFITNLGKYNEGELIGEWATLPISKEELQELFERIGINEEYEEYFITDYECDFYEVGEYENIKTLNEIAEKMGELNEEKIYIKFIIKTSYSIEKYFLEADKNKNINAQIDNALANIAFEEEYKIIDCIELSQSYVKSREKLIKIYEKLFNETVEEAFCSGEKYITLEGIIDGIEWELKTEKEKEKTLEKYL